MFIKLEERTCRICGSTYKYDVEDGSDLGCCCDKCEEDWTAFETEMEETINLIEWEE